MTEMDIEGNMYSEWMIRPGESGEEFDIREVPPFAT
jgi:hypothetical protein